MALEQEQDAIRAFYLMRNQWHIVRERVCNCRVTKSVKSECECRSLSLSSSDSVIFSALFSQFHSLFQYCSVRFSHYFYFSFHFLQYNFIYEVLRKWFLR